MRHVDRLSSLLRSLSWARALFIRKQVFPLRWCPVLGKRPNLSLQLRWRLKFLVESPTVLLLMTRRRTVLLLRRLLPLPSRRMLR